MEHEINITKAQEIIEAILFAAGYPVTYEKLSCVLGYTASEIKAIVENYSLIYNESHSTRGIQFIILENSCQLCTKEEYEPYIKDALGIKKGGNLSHSSLETLAIIAYHQPATRAFIDQIRGVDSAYSITSLLDKNLIETKGKLDVPGKPMLYGTTKDFLRVFGLNSINQLPPIDIFNTN